MITTLEQYIEGVLESESTEQRDWRAHIPTKIYRANHALTGFATEIGELLEAILRPEEGSIDWGNVKEELGDAWWYAGVLIDVHDLRESIQLSSLDLDDADDSARVERMKELSLRYVIMLGEGFDVIKRRIYYFAEELEDGHPKKEKAKWSHVGLALLELCTILEFMTQAAGFTLEEVWTANLRKLIGPNGRYAGKFDPDKALHRDLMVEREALEGGEEVAS